MSSEKNSLIEVDFFFNDVMKTNFFPPDLPDLNVNPKYLCEYELEALKQEVGELKRIQISTNEHVMTLTNQITTLIQELGKKNTRDLKRIKIEKKQKKIHTTPASIKKKFKKKNKKTKPEEPPVPIDLTEPPEEDSQIVTVPDESNEERIGFLWDELLKLIDLIGKDIDKTLSRILIVDILYVSKNSKNLTIRFQVLSKGSPSFMFDPLLKSQFLDQILRPSIPIGSGFLIAPAIIKQFEASSSKSKKKKQEILPDILKVLNDFDRTTNPKTHVDYFPKKNH